VKIEQLLPLVLLVFAFYFLLIRPQQKRTRQHQTVIQSVVVGDEIITIGGIFGTVRAVDDRTVDLQVADGTVLKLAKQAIANKVEPDVPETDVDTGTSQDQE
jgi:preprotein translocase subunit YajC